MVNARPPLLLLAAALALGSTPCPGAEPPPPPSDPYQFRNVAIGGGGFVTGIIFSRAEKGLVYLRTDVGGAYRREAGSNEWVPLLDWAGQTDWNLYGVESLACDPQDARRVYIAAGTYTNPGTPNGEILRSTNQGDTWERTPLSFKLGGNESGRNNGERLAVDPNDGRVLFLGTRTSGLWRSGDSGATWARIAAFPDYDEALPVPTNPRWRAPQRVGINIVFFDERSGARGAPTPVVYAAVSTPNASLFRSTDGGTTWAPIAGQPLGLRPTRAAFSATGVLYVSYGREAGPNTMTDGAVWRLDPSSGAWGEITPEKPGQGRAFGYGSVAVDPRRPETVLAGTWSHGNPFDEIFRSTDGGRTWTALLGTARWDHASAPYTRTMTHHWLADLEIDPFDSDHAIFPTGYGIWVTHDLGGADRGRPTLWSFEDRGIEETVPLSLVSPPSGAHLLSGLGDIDGMRHDDFGASPPSGRFGTPAFKNSARLAFAWKHPEVLVRSGNTYHNDLLTAGYSKDGGLTWKPFLSEPPGTVGAFWRGEGPLCISADARTVVWSPTAVAPHLTEDWGATWYPCVGCSVNLAVAADTVNPSRFYAYDTEAGTLVESTDRARSFKATLAGLPVVKGRFGPAPGKLSTVPGREAEIWVIAGGVLLNSHDGGLTVRTIPNVAASQIGFGKGAPGRDFPALFLVGRVSETEGIFRSDDYGSSWVRINDPRHGYGSIGVVTGDPRIFGRVYLGTFGRGIVYGDRKG